MPETAVATKRMVCGRCYWDRGRKMDLAALFNKETRKTTMFCTFCDEERHPGGMRTRVHISPDMGKGNQENVLNIPHIVMTD